ncbi:maleylacetoacetate isomerase [Alteraurantiacibacter lauratis]|uniref:Maleylacetoacetate isomerase n=1 Tax=Alteraurantiacibacter lauratis TaxID=2054627 RepID=A0ABV7EBJ5_9SPHN
MQLYSYFRSSAAFRVRIALAYKGLGYSTQAVDLRAREQHGSFADINPQMLVPFFEENGFGLGQSLAIIEYLEDIHPTPALLPSQAKDRAMVRFMAQSIACDIHPLNNLRVLRYLKRSLAIEQSGINDWYAHWIQEGFRGLETLVDAHGSDIRCFGETVTLADVCLAPQVWNAKSMDVDLSPFPHICRIYEAVMELEAFRQAAPENQPDAA